MNEALAHIVIKRLVEIENTLDAIRSDMGDMKAALSRMERRMRQAISSWSAAEQKN